MNVAANLYQLHKNGIYLHEEFDADGHCPAKGTTRKLRDMLYLAVKAALSGILIAVISEVAKRYPGFGGLIASLPLVSVLGMIWLWRDMPDATNMATHAEATFWFVLPSLPMFLLIPAMLRNGYGFWLSLCAGCILTIALYSLMVWAGSRFGLRM